MSSCRGQRRPRRRCRLLGGSAALLPALLPALLAGAGANQALEVDARRNSSASLCQDDIGWTDRIGQTCETYVRYGYCTRTGETGPGWQVFWGTTSMETLGTATKSCCACGKCPRCATSCVNPLPLQVAADFAEFGSLNCTHVEGDLDIRPYASEWLTALAGLKSISGSLYMRYGHASSLRNLSSLERIGKNFDVAYMLGLPTLAELTSLSSIGGELSVFTVPQLESLEGLRNVRSVGCLWIGVNFRLMSLAGLEGITSVTGNCVARYSIVVRANPALQSLDGLARMQGDLPGDVQLRDLPSLTSIDGLGGVTSIGEGKDFKCLTMYDLPMLTSISGLRRLRRCSGNMELRRLPLVVSIQELDRFTSVTGHLRLEDVPLETLDGLQSLTSIGGRLDLRNMVKLRSIDALSNLSKIGSIRLYDLPMLESLPTWQNITGPEDTIEISRCSALRDLSGFSSFRGRLRGGVQISSCSSLRSLQGLEGLTSVGSIEVEQCPQLESLAAFRGLTGDVLSKLRLSELPRLQSLHGLHRISGTGWSRDCACSGCLGLLPTHITIAACPQLQSIAALSSVRGGIGKIELSGVDALQSLHGIEGLLARHLSVSSLPALCITAEERQRLAELPADACGNATAASAGIQGYALMQQVSARADCSRCELPCGHLPSGEPVECDYRSGECRCPLGTMGPGCNRTVPRLSVVPGQSFQCSMSTNSTSVCTVRVALLLMPGPGNLSSPARVSLQSADGRDVVANTTADHTRAVESITTAGLTWHNATHGELLVHLLQRKWTPQLAQRTVLPLFLGYEPGLQPNVLLEGTVVDDSLADPASRIFPWCISPGAGCRLTAPEAVELTFGVEAGTVRFTHTRSEVREDQLVAVAVLGRHGGSAGTVWVAVEVDFSATTAEPGVDFHFSREVRYWQDQDMGEQAIVIRVVDNMVWAPSKTIMLSIKDVSPPGVRDSDHQHHNITLLDDGDGGRLRFHTAASIGEDAGNASECLVTVERAHGSSGNTSVEVVLDPLAQQCGLPPSAAATVDGPTVAFGVADFSFARGQRLSWGDGEDGVKCVFQGPRAARLTVYGDWTVEDNEAVCLTLADASGTAQVIASEGHAVVRILDSGTGGGRSSYMICDRGKCSCAPGWFAENSSALSDTCWTCELGHFCSGRGGQQQTPCRPGSFASTRGATACTPCREGAFQELPGASVCRSCPVGEFSNSTGASACSRCDDLWGVQGFATTGVGATSQADCACPPGAFLPCGGSECPAGARPPAGGCTACPKGFECPGGLEPSGSSSVSRRLTAQEAPRQLARASTQEILVHAGPYLKQGCFSSLDAPYCAVRCGQEGSAEKACPGLREPGVCGGAHRENSGACGACERGFHLSGGECTPCGDSVVGWVFFVLVLLCALAVLTVVAYRVNAQKSKERHGILAITATVSLGLFCMQALSVMGQFAVDWIWPADVILNAFASMVHLGDMRALKLDCSLQGMSDFTSYLLRLSAMPVMLALALAVVAVKNCRRRMHTLFRVEAIQTLGTVSLVFFILTVATVLQPFVFFGHFCEGQASLLNYPNVFAGSAEHVPFIASGVVAVLLLLLPFLAACAWATWNLPGRLSGGDAAFLNSTRFLFGKFRQEAYYYSLVQLARNALLCSVPVIMRDNSAGQILLSTVVIVLPMVVQIKIAPWRLPLMNHVETGCLVMLLMFLCFGSLLTDRPTDVSGMQAVCVMMFFILLLLLMSCFVWALFFLMRPRKVFTFFVCHCKGDAGAQARMLQLRLAQYLRWHTEVFIDADHLFNLDALFETVRMKVANLVVFLTRNTLHRPWCAGEITTALQNGVPIIVVRCSDFVVPNLRHLPDSFDYAASGLAQYGLRPEDILAAYGSLMDMKYIEAARKLGDLETAALAEEIFGWDTRLQGILKCNAGFVHDTSLTNLEQTKPEGNIVVLTDPSDAEGVAGAVILYRMMLPQLDETCFLQVASGMSPMTSKDLIEYLSVHTRKIHEESIQSCHTAIVVLSRTTLSSPDSICVILRTMQRMKAGGFSVISVCLPGFAYPSADYYEQELPRLLEWLPDSGSRRGVKGLKRFFKLISVHLNTHGSKAVLQAQVCEVIRRISASARGSQQAVGRASEAVDRSTSMAAQWSKKTEFGDFDEAVAADFEDDELSSGEGRDIPETSSEIPFENQTQIVVAAKEPRRAAGRRADGRATERRPAEAQDIGDSAVVPRTGGYPSVFL